MSNTRKEHHLEPIVGPGPKTKRRIGVMPTRRELDKKKKEKGRRPPRHERSGNNVLAYISHW